MVVGLLASLFSLGQFLTSFALGHVSDRIGRRPVLLVGMAASATLLAVFGFSNTVLVASLNRFLEGFLNACIPVSKALLSDLTRDDAQHRAEAFAYFGASFGCVRGARTRPHECKGPCGLTTARPQPGPRVWLRGRRLRHTHWGAGQRVEVLHPLHSSHVRAPAPCVSHAERELSNVRAQLAAPPCSSHSRLCVSCCASRGPCPLRGGGAGAPLLHRPCIESHPCSKARACAAQRPALRSVPRRLTRRWLAQACDPSLPTRSCACSSSSTASTASATAACLCASRCSPPCPPIAMAWPSTPPAPASSSLCLARWRSRFRCCSSSAS